MTVVLTLPGEQFLAAYLWCAENLPDADWGSSALRKVGEFRFRHERQAMLFKLAFGEARPNK